MAKATVNQVLLEAGLDEDTAYHLLRMSSEAELHAFVTQKIASAAGYLRAKITATIYDAVSDTDRTEAITQAEIWKAASLVVKVIEARKVFGTHWAVDSEDSTGYAGLIEQWERMLAEFLDELAVIDEGAPTYIPAIALTTGIDRTQITIWPDLLQDDIDISVGLIGEEVLS